VIILDSYEVERFKPAYNTCYRPDLCLKNKCNECELNGYAYCKMHPNFKEMKEEFEKKFAKK
jgi:hypothetical protein